jgi:(1->4)-alpha-D-glucan 1-alpha-D-glucosylmutase
MEDVRRFVDSLIAPGRINSLSQTLIKLTAPGVPDLYRGTELWALHLVDPDNRRPVDYEARRQALAAVQSLSPQAIWQRLDAGLPKLWVTHTALQLRRRRPDAFSAQSSYTPVDARGPLAGHVVAFQRAGSVTTIVPRLVMKAEGRWRGTTVPLSPGVWENVIDRQRLNGDEVDLADLWREFPVALLERVDERGHR